eukprot:12021235-Heterocapsa_arctica.AAC.1
MEISRHLGLWRALSTSTLALPSLAASVGRPGRRWSGPRFLPPFAPATRSPILPVILFGVLCSSTRARRSGPPGPTKGSPAAFPGHLRRHTALLR